MQDQGADALHELWGSPGSGRRTWAESPTRLPAPEMPLLTPHDEYSLGHLIEKHINFVAKDKEGNEHSVALDPVFVRHYMKYRDSETAGRHRDRDVTDGASRWHAAGDARPRSPTRHCFRLQPELLAVLPTPADCTDSVVAEAIRFLITNGCATSRPTTPASAS